MSDRSLAEQVRYFEQVLGIPTDAPWLHPPVTNAQIRATEEALGHDLPPDLVAMYSVHNGGRLYNGLEWLGALDPDGPSFGKVEHFDLDWFVSEEVSDHTDIMPGPRTLRVATASHRMLLYDMDDQPGRLLYLQIVANNTLVPLSSSLRAYVDCQVEFAERGYVVAQPVGPHFGGKPLVWSDEFVDGFIEICLKHGVCPAYHLGTDVWLKRPEAASFSID